MSAVLSRALSTSCASIDAFMTLLIAPDRWRDANSFQRQQTLSSLVSRCSLLTELAVGGILIADAAQSLPTEAQRSEMGCSIALQLHPRPEIWPIGWSGGGVIGSLCVVSYKYVAS